MALDIKDRLAKLAEMVFWTVIILALVFGMVYLSFEFFTIPIGYSMALQVSVVVIFYKVYRWWRWPGTYHGKSSRRLIADTVLSVLFFWSVPILAVLAQFHALGFVPIRKIARKLDLAFPFETREMLQVSRVAPPQYFPGAWGKLRKVRVVSLNESLSAPLPVGCLIYRVDFGSGIQIDIPETEVIPPDD